MAAPLAREVGHLALDARQVRCRRPIVMQQQFAGGIEPHAARQSLEQFGAELLLEAVDAPVQRRGGDAHVFGGLAHRPGAGDRLDQAEGVEVLHSCISFAGGAFYAPHR